MALFRKGSDPTPEHPVTSFWAWWGEVSSTLDPRRVSETTSELTRRVQAINPDLVWHFGPGKIAEHRLTVSANGVAEVRPSAERWLRAAPPSNETWEFRSSQEADPGGHTNTLEIAGSKLDLGLTTFASSRTQTGSRLDVCVFHPAFRDMPHGAPQQVAFLVLDWLIGEDNVERWIGQIETVIAEPSDPITASTLAQRVEQLAANESADEWALGQWQAPDGTIGLASYRPWLRWLDYPTLDRHHLVTVTYRAQSNGLPADSRVLDDLRETEDQLMASIAPRAILVGHESSRGARIFHVYSDGDDQNADAAISAYAVHAGHTIRSASDPGWRAVRHLSG